MGKGAQGNRGARAGAPQGAQGNWGCSSLQGVLSRVLFLLTTTGGAPSRALPGAPPISLSTLWSTPPSTPISLSTLGSTSQSTLGNSHFSTPVTDRRDCKPSHPHVPSWAIFCPRDAEALSEGFRAKSLQPLF